MNVSLVPYFNTTAQNATLENMYAYGNAVTNNLAGPMLMSVLWLLLMIAFGYQNKSDAGLTASAITLLVSGLLSMFGGFVPMYFVLVNLAAFLLFVVIKTFSKT